MEQRLVKAPGIIVRVGPCNMFLGLYLVVPGKTHGPVLSRYTAEHVLDLLAGEQEPEVVEVLRTLVAGIDLYETDAEVDRCVVDLAIGCWIAFLLDFSNPIGLEITV